MEAERTEAEVAELWEKKRWEWIKDPVLFCAEVLGIGVCRCQNGKPHELDANQKRELYNLSRLCLVKMKKYCSSLELSEAEKALSQKIGTSIQSGKGVGKTCLAALVAIWFFVCFKMARVVILGPKYDQIKDNLWAEISKWLEHAVSVLGEGCLIDQIIEKQSDKILMKDVNRMAKGDKWVIKILTFPKNSSIEAQKAAVQGQHDDNMLFICDEASGIPDHIFEPVEGTLTSTSGVNAVFVIFNPNRNTGWAIETQKKMSSKWITSRINALNSKLVSETQIEYMKMKFGEGSNAYRVAVLGLEPVAEEGALIPWTWLQDSVERGKVESQAYVEINDDDPIILGVDIGGGGKGDISCICVRKGWHVLRFLKNTSEDTDEVCNWIKRVIVRYGAKITIIDMNGIGHQTYYNILNSGFKVIGVNSMDSSREKNRFFRLRDQLFFYAREAFEKSLVVLHESIAYREEEGINSEDLEEFISELSLLKYDDIGTGGKIKIISKKNREYRQAMIGLTGHDSPNMADAFSLTLKVDVGTMFAPRKYLRNSKTGRFKSDNLTSRRNSWMRG